MRWSLATFLACGCVTLAPEQLPIAHNPLGEQARNIRPPGPEARAAAGLRFLVRAYGEGRAEAVARTADRDYERLMAHTGLFSFRPGGLYPVWVYRDEAEYLQKTGSPEWTGGIALGNAIFTYEGPELETTLAHEIVHLIFQEYMEGPGRLRWFNEGLAVYEELQVAAPAKQREIEAWMDACHQRPMPFSEMAAYAPGDSRTARWYGQSASVARYLVEVGGRSGVARFLEAVKTGSGLDAALAQSFPTLCTDLYSLERRWRQAGR